MKELVSEIRSIIESARTNAVRSVDFCRVQMYWQIGRRIVEEEQGGQARAEYGKGLIKNLAKETEPEFGSGFSFRQLAYSRKFYLEFPIVHALRAQFNWTQYKALIDIPDKDKREYYELEAANNCRCMSIITIAQRNCQTKIRQSAYCSARLKTTPS